VLADRDAVHRVAHYGFSDREAHRAIGEQDLFQIGSISKSFVNNPTAQYNLGIMYWNGKGVERDKISAHVWFNLASAGFPETESRRRSSAIRTRDLVGSEMSSNEIAEAQKRAREWKPKQTPQS
jgi:hypothetical protein